MSATTRSDVRYADPMIAPPANRRTADDAVVPDAETSDGVDVSLVRWTLSLTPAERLDVLQAFVDSVFELRGAGRRA